ncbi:hypothetical protein HDV00_002841 [Rhizophlyctis rosea]|nr:hypothetical protein HDV00_002841 [Rhizophlyctis rosea]
MSIDHCDCGQTWGQRVAMVCEVFDSIHQILANLFNNRIQLRHFVSPDEVIVSGAAKAAAHFGHAIEPSPYWHDPCGANALAVDTNPFDLCIATSYYIPPIDETLNLMTPILPRCIWLAAQRSITVTTGQDNQTSMLIQLYVGDRPLTSMNHYLANLVLDDIHPAPKGIPQIEISVSIDAGAVITITAHEKSTPNKTALLRVSWHDYPEDEQLRALVDDADENREADMALRDVIDARRRLESHIRQLSSHLSHTPSISLRAQILASIESKSEWLMNNYEGVTKEEYDRHRAELNFEGIDIDAGIVHAVADVQVGWGVGGAGRDLDEVPDYDEL